MPDRRGVARRDAMRLGASSTREHSASMARRIGDATQPRRASCPHELSHTSENASMVQRFPGCAACVSIVHPSTASSSSLSFLSRARYRAVPHGPLILRFGSRQSRLAIVIDLYDRFTRRPRAHIHAQIIFEGGIWRARFARLSEYFNIGAITRRLGNRFEDLQNRTFDAFVYICRNVPLGFFLLLTR